MQDIAEELWVTWEQGTFVGDNKPNLRATISKTTLRTSEEFFRTLLHEGNFQEVEIPNVKTITIDRRLGTDAATMQMTLVNAGTPLVDENLDESYSGSGPTKRQLGEFGSPGLYSYRRGLSTPGGGDPNPWGYEPDSTWADMFLPNRVVRTWQGYGTDGSAEPWTDTKLAPTGIWLIDSVDMSADGLISISCRDMAKLLIEQRLYPPIIPLDNYPLTFCGPYKKEFNESTPVTTGNPEVIGENVATHSTRAYDSSAAPWYGTNATVYGHKASDAFDGDETTFWISMRNSVGGISTDWSFEWLDADTHGEPVNQVRFKPWTGNYVLYVCVNVGGVWQGSATVPYNPNAGPAYPNTANTKYVLKTTVPVSENWMTIDLPETYNADYVRLTFTNLQNFGRISGGDYRAGVYEFEVNAVTPSTVTEVITEETIVTNEEGNTKDYTDIIKILLSWSGFYWKDGRPDDELLLRDVWGGKGGRVWGDFFYSGAYPIDPPCIDASYWDNKSVMDGINQIKEILGFIGYVDTTGGFIWRPPNIWRTGNFVTGLGFKAGEDWIREVSEQNTLLDYGVIVDDKNLRSEVVVISSDDPTLYGSYQPGYASGEEVPSTIESQAAGEAVVSDLSLLAGQERIMLVPDYPWGQNIDDPFRAQAEVEKFAYLVTLWIHWSYRKGKFRIPGNPAFQPDDQVRIFERTTSETYVHYLTGVRSTMNLDSGEYYLDVDTHWLGNGPDAQWHMYVADMSPALFAYLCSVGQLPPEICDPDAAAGGGIDLPEGWEIWTPVDIPDPLPRDPTELQKLYPELPSVNDVSYDFDYESPYPTTGTDASDGTGIVVPPEAGGSSGTVLNCTNGWLDRYWTGAGPNSGNCCAAGLSRYKFFGSGGSYSYMATDSRVIRPFLLLSELFVDEGIPVVWASGCVCRTIKGSSTWSNHAYGVAADINSGYLPWGKSINNYTTVGGVSAKKYVSVGTRAGAIRALDTNYNPTVPVFKWGERFRKSDPMHWQVCCDPRALARGVYNIDDGPPPPGPS